MGMERDQEQNETFMHPWIDSEKQIRLLEIDAAGSTSRSIECSLSIINVSDLPDTDYSALSYSWGEARTDEDIHKVFVDNQAFWVRTSLWTFLYSAQNLTIRMPIYVDAICLNQLDDEERSNQVRLMAQVYSHASHAHVWLGLPHWDQVPNLQALRKHLSEDSSPVSWSVEAFVGLSYLCSRNYWRRLWIVQELLLSSTVSIHCGHSTFAWEEVIRYAKHHSLANAFEPSGNTTWWDAWNFPRPIPFFQERNLDDRIFEGWQSASRLFRYRNEWLSTTTPLEVLDARPQPKGLPFHQAVSAFRLQQCRDKRDRVFALVGLLDDEGKRMISPDYHNSLDEVYVQAAAAGIVSRWRANLVTGDLSSLRYETRMFCDMLNSTLGLHSLNMEVRVTEAMRIATSYVSSLQDSSRGEDFLGSATDDPLSYAIPESADFDQQPQPAELAYELRSPESSLQQSFREFQGDMTDADRRIFAATRLADLQKTIAVIQNKQRATRTLQNTTRLKAFLHATDAYGELLDACVGSREVVAFVWGAMDFILQVATRRSDAFDGMLSQYERLGECLPPFTHIRSLSDVNGHQSEILGGLFLNIFEMHKVALRFFKNPAWQQLFSSSWPHLQAKFATFAQNMEDHKNLIDSQIEAQELSEARQGREENSLHFSELLEHARRARAETEEQFSRLAADEVVRRRVHLFSWLSAPETASDLDHCRAVRESGSGQWLLTNSRFRAWYNPSSVSVPLLWVTGKPGAGKSVLSSLVIDDALQLPRTTTLFFYCKHDDQEKNTFLGMARSILRQLLMSDDTLLLYMFEMATTKGETKLATIKLAKSMLTTCLKALGRTYVIIDGIDECQPSEQQNIAKFWMTYVESSGADPEPSRCAFFGQEDANTRPMFCKLPSIHIQGQGHDSDIHSYCSATAQELLGQFGLTARERSEIVSQTSCRANGMFLFARLVMKTLSQQVTKADLETEMDPAVFPTGLNEAYARITQRILVQASASYRKHAQRLLAWICCATRPLKWREIQAAASIDMGRQMLDFERYRLTVDAKALCGALVEELPNGDVAFVHSTVKQYLLNNTCVNAAAEHTSLAELCLGYFSLPAFSVACTNDELRANLMAGTYAFTEYAMISWTTHLESVLESLAEAPFPQTLSLIVDDFFRIHWKKPRKRSKPTKRIRELTSRIAQLEIHDRTRDSISSMHCLMSTNLTNAESVQTLDLFGTMARFRSALEELAADADVAGPLEQFYGTRLYKCPRMYCKWFHEGFLTKHERELHVEKHERSHLCSVVGCIYETLGFPAANQLSRHVADVHQTGPTEEDFPALVDGADSPEEALLDAEPSVPIEQYGGVVGQPDSVSSPGTEVSSEHTYEQSPTMTQQTAPRRRGRAGPSTHECSLCQKVFTRAFTLQSHMRSHTDERPYECNVCRKKFARKRDWRRHQESHTGQRNFVCGGNLQNGALWGCGRRFARADALNRHFRSEAGRACNRALIDEAEEANRQRTAPSIDRANWLPTIDNLLSNTQ